MRVFKNDKKQTFTAIIDDGNTDALVKVLKKLGIKHSVTDNSVHVGDEFIDAFTLPLIIHSNNTGTVRVHGGDEYDEKVGYTEACRKAIRNHKVSVVKAIKRWQVRMIKYVMLVQPETFEEALTKARK